MVKGMNFNFNNIFYRSKIILPLFPLFFFYFLNSLKLIDHYIYRKIGKTGNLEIYSELFDRDVLELSNVADSFRVHVDNNLFLK